MLFEEYARQVVNNLKQSACDSLRAVDNVQGALDLYREAVEAEAVDKFLAKENGESADSTVGSRAHDLLREVLRLPGLPSVLSLSLADGTTLASDPTQQRTKRTATQAVALVSSPAKIERPEAKPIPLAGEGHRIAIFGGEPDEGKLTRIRETTGLGKGLQWFEVEQSKPLSASIQQGKITGVVFVSGLMSHGRGDVVMEAIRETRTPMQRVYRPGISTIMLAVEAVARGETSDFQAPGSAGKKPPAEDPDIIFREWVQALRKIPKKNVRIAPTQVYEILGLKGSVSPTARSRVVQVMSHLGWTYNGAKHFSQKAFER